MRLHYEHILLGGAAVRSYGPVQRLRNRQAAGVGPECDHVYDIGQRHRHEAAALFLLQLAQVALGLHGGPCSLQVAEDHINDVASNLGAIAAAVVTKHWHAGWWVDPVAAIAISLVILGRWCFITYSQVLKLVGQAAPQEFVRLVEGIASQHHPQLLVDVTRAYSFGARYNVEMEVVLPADMTVADSHDIALDLQHKIEGMEEVERAFVHVDYMKRHLPEHKVERTLWLSHCGDTAVRQATAAVIGTRLIGSPV